MNGKPSSPVLRGLGASDGARLLDPNRVTSELLVIRSQSVASANGASKFYVPDLRLEAIVAPLLFRHVGVLKAWRFSSLCRWIRAPVEVVNLRESSASKEAG